MEQKRDFRGKEVRIRLQAVLCCQEAGSSSDSLRTSHCSPSSFKVTH